MHAKNLFAHTAPGSDMPEFLSVNEEADGKISVHCRSPKEIGGHTAMCPLDRKQARELGLALIQATND